MTWTLKSGRVIRLPPAGMRALYLVSVVARELEPVYQESDDICWPYDDEDPLTHDERREIAAEVIKAWRIWSEQE